MRLLSLMQLRVRLKESMAGSQANPSRGRWCFIPKRVVRLSFLVWVWVAPTKCVVKILKGQADWPRLVEELKVFVMMRFNSVIVWLEVCLRAMDVFLASAFLVVVMGLFTAPESSVLMDRPDGMVLEGGGEIEEPHC